MRRAALLAALALIAGCGAPQRPLTGFAIGLYDETPAPSTGIEVAERPSPATPVPSPTPTAYSGEGHSGGGSAPHPTPTPSPASVGLSVATGDRYAIARVAGDAEGGVVLGADALGARFDAVSGLAVAPDGTLWASDPVNHQIRRIPASGPTSVAAGDPTGRAGYLGDNVPATATRLNTPMGLAVDPGTGAVLVADTGNGRVRVFPPGGRIYTLAGGGGFTTDTVASATGAFLQQPWGLAVDTARRVLLTDRGTGKLRRIEADGRLTTLRAFTPGALGAIASSLDGETVWVAEGAKVWRYAPTLGAAPTLTFDAGTGAVTGLAYDQAGSLFVLATATADGLDGTQLWRVPTALSGRPAVRIAGQPGTGASPSDYSLGPAGLPDAVTARLAAAHGAGLAIDLIHAADPDTASGRLYQANNHDDAGVRWGEINRLTP